MKIQGMGWTKVVVLGMALSLVLSFGCAPAFGQTAAQKLEQERERQAAVAERAAAAAEQQRERAAEQQRERAAEQQRERAAEQQREQQQRQQQQQQQQQRPVQPAYVPNNTPAPARTTPNNTYPSNTPNNTSQPRTAYTPNNSSTPAQPRAYTPAPAQPSHPATVYTPHAAGSSASSSSSGATTSKPSTPGPTVYTPHAASSAGAASTSTPSSVGAPAHVNGATVYTPHAAASSSAGSAASTAPVHSSPVHSSPASSAGSTVSASSPMPIHAAYTMPSASSIASKTSNHSVLTPAGSQRVVSQVNTARASLAGVNKRALPTGQVTVQSSGRLALTASGGRQYGLRPNGTLASFKSTQGGSAKFAPNGRFRSVQTAGMKIQYGPHGGRTVVKQLPNHATLVSFGRHSGYVQRPIAHAGASLVQRTYVAPRSGFFTKNTTYVQTFRTYTYRGVPLLSYAPAVYYAPEFYGWAYYPWATPAAYAWGWTGDAWVNAYSGYFAPLSAYSSPAQWMADYILGATLAKAYQEQQDFEPADADAAADDLAADEAAPAEDAAEGEVYAQTATPITPEIRAAVAEEVRQELASENAIASDQATPEVDQLQEILQPKHFFVVSTLLNVSSDQGNCALTGGDIIGVVKATGSEADTATLTVASGKKGDCPAGAQVEVAVQDLQEMDNNLRAQMDNAVAKLHSEQGQGGLPAAPKSAIAPPPRPAMDDVPSTPETGVSAMLGQEQDQAAQAEASVVKAAFASNAGGI
jgi:hypothetical protein